VDCTFFCGKLPPPLLVVAAAAAALSLILSRELNFTAVDCFSFLCGEVRTLPEAEAAGSEAADSGDRMFKISAKAKAFPIDVTHSAFLAEEVGLE
jgi:hypothetical protein